MKENIIGAIAVLALILSGWAVLSPNEPSSGAATAPTGMLLEQYVPVVQYNGGIKTALPISMLASGTSTMFMKSSSATQGFCMEFNATSSGQVDNLTFAATSSNVTTSTTIIPVVSTGACN